VRPAAAALIGGLLAVVLGSPPLAAAPHIDLGSSVVQVPFEYRDHLITISARINGAGPFRLMVDTGATLAVTPAVAKAAHLTLESGPLPIIGNGPGVGAASGIAAVDRIDVGGLSLYDAQTLVFDQPASDGIIGYPLFASLRVTIDFPGRTIDLSDAQEDGPLTGSIVPMFITQGHFPTVAGSIDGTPGLVRVDTGANQGLLVNSTFVRDHNIPARRTGYEWNGSAVGGLTRETIVAPLKLAMGSLQFGPVDTSVSLLSSGMSADPHSAGTVGTRLLERYIVTFDYLHREISFVRR
jgi:predicted aspartyl protease